MKQSLLVIASLLCFFVSASSQEMKKPVTEGTQTFAVARNQQPSLQTQPLNALYDTTACGVNYTQASVRLGQRGIGGLVQPAAFTITGIPPCSVIEKAYLWTTAAGTGIPVTAIIANPSSQVFSYPMTMIGNDVDMCWGAFGTYSYRADVTSCVYGNGNYMISGLPTDSVASQNSNDVDGATLMIIYRDLSASYTGSIWIEDGCSAILGGTHSETFNGLSFCQNTSSAHGFAVVADLQFGGSQIQVNGGPAQVYNSFNWWDFVTGPTTFASSQTSSTVAYTSAGDCFTVAAMGIYAQSNCSSCGSGSGTLSMTSNITPSNCNNNGSATINVTNGTGPYTYLWYPGGQNTQTVNNLAPGTYTVVVTDPTGCGTSIITINNNGVIANATTTPYNCLTLGTASCAVTGGTGPYTFLWSPGGQTTQNVSNLVAGTYSVIVTDANNCMDTSVCVVANLSTLAVTANTVPAGCGMSNGGIGALVSGGNPPYSYLWSTGATTSNIIGQAGTYTLTLTDNAGCVIMQAFTIPQLPLSINIQAFPPIITCSQSTQLYCSPNFNATSFSWLPTAGLSNPNIAQPLASPLVTTTYTVTVSSLQCGTMTATVTVTVDTTTTVNESICLVTVDSVLNKNIVVIERTQNINSGTYDIYKEVPLYSGNYVLYTSQPVAQLSQFVDQASTPSVNPERYKLRVTDSCGRHSAIGPRFRTIYLNVNSSSFNPIYLTWNLPEGFTFNILNIWRGTNPGQLSMIATLQGNVMNYADFNAPSGTVYYAIEVPHPSGCVATQPLTPYPSAWSNIASTNPNGMNDLVLLQNSISIAPNPAHDLFELSFMLNTEENIRVDITDLTGRIISETRLAGSGKVKRSFSTENFAAGTYFVLVSTSSGRVAAKLIIE